MMCILFSLLEVLYMFIVKVKRKRSQIFYVNSIRDGE